LEAFSGMPENASVWKTMGMAAKLKANKINRIVATPTSISTFCRSPGKVRIGRYYTMFAGSSIGNFSIYWCIY
jgi:hypothetical protein